VTFLGRKTSKGFGFALTAIGAALTLVAMGLGADQLCRYDIDRRLPYYPGAELVKLENDFLRPRAIGKTTMIFLSPDDLETVASWYRELNLDLLNRGLFHGLSSINRWYEANPTGKGTMIYYVTECGI
jgi:hypothetical protein